MKCCGEPLTRTDYITLGFICFQCVILVLNWSFLPTAELDTPYHLLMGKMFADYDTIMLWDYYEYAPTGRPHLYPPLEHIVLWFLHDTTGVDWWELGQFISLIQYPLPMLMVWFFCKKLFNPVIGLASVIFLSVSSEFWFWQVSVAPTAIIVSLYPLLLYCFYRKKVIASIALLTAFLYLHLGLPYVVILSVFIFSLFSIYKTKAYLRQFAIVTGVSVLLFTPWIIHILIYREWLNFGSPGRFSPLDLLTGINVLTALFFVIGLWKCLTGAKTDLKYLLVLSGCIGFLGVAVYGWRYGTHSPVINCIVGGIGFGMVYTKFRAKPTTSRKMAAVGLLLLLIPLGAFSLKLSPGISVAGPLQKAPDNVQPPIGQLQPPNRGTPLPLPPGQLQPPNQQFQSNQQNQPPRQPRQQPTNLRLQQSPLLEMLNALKTGKRPPRTWQITNPEIDELIQWVITHTSEDEILHMENGMFADYIALFTGRRTDAGMYREVTSPELFQAVQEGKKSGIFIIEEQKFRERGVKPSGMTVLEQFGNLLVLQGMKPEPMPRDIPFRLNDFFILLERPDTQTMQKWLNIITQITPNRVYLGVRQKDITTELHTFITELSRTCQVGIAIIVEDVNQPINVPNVAAVRLILPQEKLSSDYIESVHQSLNPSTELEIAVLGPPLYENKKAVESLTSVLPIIDRVVRHIPPNVEFVHIAQQEQQLFKDKFFIQIDTQRGEFELRPDELYMLIQAAHKIVQDRIILEFMYPPAHPELLNFLKTVYAE